jgi:hypothetical protein
MKLLQLLVMEWFLQILENDEVDLYYEKARRQIQMKWGGLKQNRAHSISCKLVPIVLTDGGTRKFLVAF